MQIYAQCIVGESVHSNQNSATETENELTKGQTSVIGSPQTRREAAGGRGIEMKTE